MPDVTSELATAIKDFGFPIVAAMGLGYFVYYVWKWVTTEIKPVLGEASSTLIALIDRIRMLDNDMIRLNQKINMILEFKEQYEKVTGKKLDLDADEIEITLKETQDSKGKSSKPKCETCGHDCHRDSDCKECVNDVCFRCQCPDCRYQALR